MAPAVTAVRSLALILAASLLALAGCGSSGSSSAAKRSSSALVAIGAGLDGPSGLHASVYAHGPATTATFAFDPQGRLWLSAAGLETHTNDGVYLISKPGAPGLKVISGLDDPLGLAWYRGRLYVASVGRVDAFGGFDGTRFTTRTEVLRGPVAGGENNNLVLAPSGRFLMGVTATCDHCTPTSRYSGAIVSFLPSGSGLDVYAGRIRAPVGLTFVPGTSELFTTMNQRDDLGVRTPGDWLALVREGQSWGFPDCYGQGGAVCDGVPQPVAVLDPHAAVGGVAIVSGALSPGSATSAIVAEWQTGKLQRIALTRSAGGYAGTVAPFVTGIKKPLAVILASDHSLLLGDWETGTIYRVASG